MFESVKKLHRHEVIRKDKLDGLRNPTQHLKTSLEVTCVSGNADRTISGSYFDSERSISKYGPLVE